MHNNSSPAPEDYWVIWNGAYGIVDTVTIERTLVRGGTTLAWLNEPYELVGPFDFDQLKNTGCLHYEACLLMSAQKWQEEQVALRQASLRLKREAMARAQAQEARFNQRREAAESNRHMSEAAWRAWLRLPAGGALKASQIKAAYRRVAQKTHPDQGGSAEEFVQITQARDALLRRVTGEK